MTLQTKLLVYLGSIIILGLLVFVIFKQIDNAKQLSLIQQQIIQQKQLVDGLVQSSNQYTTKNDLEKFIQANTNDLKAIQDNLKQLGAQLVAANVIVATSQGQHLNNVPSSHTGTSNPNPPSTTITCKDGSPCPNNDPFNYQLTQQQLDLHEDFTTSQIPLGTVGFSAWQQSPWSLTINPREYRIANVIGQDENQRIYVDNKFTIKVNNKEYIVPIKTADTKQVVPSAKMSWWNPQLMVGMDGGLRLSDLPSIKGEYIPSINLGIASYGKFKNQPDISFAQVGVGYGVVSQRPQLVITPVAFNVNKIVPFMHNTYLAPSINIGTDGGVAGGFGLRLAL